MQVEYTHMELDCTVESVGGHFVMEKEEVLQHGGRDVLVVFGYAIVNKSCCGTGGCQFARVPGYVVELRSRKSADGSPVSLVEPVTDPDSRRDISTMIQMTDPYCQVNF